MKKYVITAVLVFMFMIAILSCCSNKYDYPAGKDTVAQFGNGMFHTSKGPDGNIALFHHTGGGAIMQTVDEIHQEKNRVFLTGHDGNNYSLYGVINLSTNQVRICAIPISTDMDKEYKLSCSESLLQDETVCLLNDFSDFSKSEQEVLNLM